MKLVYRIIITAILILLPVSISVSQVLPVEKYKKGTELYTDGNYKKALEQWSELYNSGYRSAGLEYNIGNAFFKLSNIPGAILYYERALLRKPADEDIIYNLQIARTMVVDKFEAIPELFFVIWFDFLSLSLSTNTWAFISLFSFILLLLFFSLYIYSSRYRNKVIGFWIAVLMLIISASSVSFALRNRTLVYNNNGAIVFSPLVNGKSSPDASGNDLFVLHEGTKVTIEDEVGEWYEIRLSDGNKGWVPANCLNKI